MHHSLLPVLAPTSSLPPLGRLQNHSADQVSEALGTLERLYWPTDHKPGCVRLPTNFPSRAATERSARAPVTDSGYASAEEEDSDSDETDSVSELRADSFERQFVINWLTGFIGRSDRWTTAGDDEDENDRRAVVVEDATHILSVFVNHDDTEAATEFAITRTFDFHTALGTPIRVELNDAPLVKDDHTSVGLQSWGSSILLAKKVCASPADFLPSNRCRPVRILELGAGTGLLSIVTAKIRPESVVVATDYHPEVLSNLADNVKTNFADSSAQIQSPISVQHLDWEKPCGQLDESFDIILAADVIYQPDHALWIKNCVKKFLLQPDMSTSGGLFWLMIPIRSSGRHEGLDQTVSKYFLEPCDISPRLSIVIQEDVPRQDNVGRADEDGYRLFGIRWVE